VDVRSTTPLNVISLLDWFWTVGRSPHECVISGAWNGTERITHIRRREEGDIVQIRTTSETALVGEQTTETPPPHLADYELETVVGSSRSSGILYVTADKIRSQKPEVQNLPGRFVSVFEQGRSRPLAPLWSQVQERGEQDGITKLLKDCFDEDIESVSIGSDELGRALLRIVHKQLGRIPLEFCGGGLGKALAIACEVVASANGVLIIDEFDASLHVAAQSRVVGFTLRAAKKHNVQLFVSTHSLETLDAFLDAYAHEKDLWSSPGDLRVIQLSRHGTRTEVRNLDAEKASFLRGEMALDLRRAT
jgi:ABC-type dipeptide/oligopeptide/nickel transport system ATPase component